jgi:hypothetical protein
MCKTCAQRALECGKHEKIKKRKVKYPGKLPCLSETHYDERESLRDGQEGFYFIPLVPYRGFLADSERLV